MFKKLFTRILLPLGVVTTLGCAVIYNNESENAMRQTRMEQSSNYADGKFQNSIPTAQGSMGKILKKYILTTREDPTPTADLPLNSLTKEDFNSSPEESQDFKFTWLGHATVLIQIDGKYILTDPVFSKRVSPVQWAGPSRFHPVPISIEDLPELDAVLISHDHYDHLDKDTVKKLEQKTGKFLVPLGIGKHFENWGISSEKVVEFDWWEDYSLDGIQLVSTPARHFSGRGILDRDKTLWCSWVIKGKNNSLYFSGDTGMFPTFKEIGEKYGPFDLTMMAVGAYDPLWANIHLNPEEAVQAHQDLKGKVMLPIHWGSFDLAMHSWYEPVERLDQSGREQGVESIFPILGQTMDMNRLEVTTRWWKGNSSLAQTEEARRESMELSLN